MNDYFINMFKKIDDKIVLDKEQIEIIKNNDENLMVIAGAGSGKTTTISAKVNYLIEKKNIKDEEILVISFTNKAVNELKERINKDFKHNVKVLTFHKLGYEIIKASKKNIKIVKEPNKIIKDYIENEIINNKKELKKFLELFTYYFNIELSVNMFKTHEKYYLYKNKKIYHTLKNKIEYIEKNINNYEKTTTKEEQLIANYLFINNIEYKYKEPYNKKYTPDFTIYQNNQKYYIEYFDMNKINKFKYENNIKKIRKLHKNNNLIEIYNDDIIETLDNKLNKLNIKKDEENISKIFENLIIKNKDQDYEKFIEFSKTIISFMKKNEDKELKKLKECRRNLLFKNYIKKLYDYYELKLKNNHEIDFDDMINHATKKVEENKQKLKYKYIIIDEYQDISINRFELIKKIKKITKSKLMVVGDDWQSIYKFTSSNLNLFTQFKKYIGNCTILKITKTYRNSNELINIAGKFVQENNEQIKKQLVSNKTLKYPVKLLLYKKNKIIKKIIEGIEYLVKKYPNKNILILGRYTFDIKLVIDEINFINKNNKIIYKKEPNINIEYMTVHASKGLGYDNVIIINALNNEFGFPSKIKDDPIIKEMLEQEEYKYAEERRLFYVALTRTKNEVIILTPYTNESEFISEIKRYEQVKKYYTLK